MSVHKLFGPMLLSQFWTPNLGSVDHTQSLPAVRWEGYRNSLNLNGKQYELEWFKELDPDFFTRQWKVGGLLFMCHQCSCCHNILGDIDSMFTFAHSVLTVNILYLVWVDCYRWKPWRLWCFLRGHCFYCYSLYSDMLLGVQNLLSCTSTLIQVHVYSTV